MTADSFNRAQSGLKPPWGDQRSWFEKTGVELFLRSAVRWHDIGMRQRVAATLFSLTHNLGNWGAQNGLCDFIYGKTVHCGNFRSAAAVTNATTRANRSQSCLRHS
jgi:hypothetical protein